MGTSGEFEKGAAVGRVVVAFMCTESPWALAQLLKNKSQSEVLIFPHILEDFPVLERLIELSEGNMFSLFPLNLSSYIFNLVCYRQ